MMILQTRRGQLELAHAHCAEGQLAKRPRCGPVTVALIAWMAACLVGVSTTRQVLPGSDLLMSRVGERVVNYYRRVQRVICIETSTVQPIARDWRPEGFSRIVESELHVESGIADGDTPPEPTVVRDIRRINRRAPRDRDKKDRAGCTDPNPLSPEPLAFLLPAYRGDYRFTSVRHGREDDRAALIIDFVSANRTSKPQLIEDGRGHDDCFDWSGPVATRGRVWVDANTNDVLRVERRIDGPVDVRVPWELQRRYRLPAWIVVDRDDLTIRYKAVRFSDPDEIILLPESVESLTVVRSGLQSIRRTDTLSGYRRFLTTGRVKHP